MRKTIVLVLGCAFAVLLFAGFYGAAGTDRSAYCAEEADLTEDRIMTEPSDAEALSVDEDTVTEQSTGFIINGRTNVLKSEPEISGRTGDEPESRQAAERLAEADLQATERVAKAAAPEVSGIRAHLYEERRGIFGAIQRFYHPLDVPPKDTVRYTESRREEITHTRYVESVVDENDPNTYEVIEKEQTVPSMYVNRAGDIKYAFEDGVWYEYKYSNVNVNLAIKNDQLALTLLKPRGNYDRLELMEMDCQEIVDENGQIQYQYNARYCGICAMDQSPVRTSHLTAVDLGIVAATMQVKSSEKVPVLMEVTEGTGEYRYYGWQVLDGKTCYFDEYGKKVTGEQVIQGIRHEFDEEGVKISRAGVEVSEETGAVDWKRVKAAKIDLALIQCAFRDSVSGQLIPDARAEENLISARQAGLVTGITLFSQAVTMKEAVEEAEYLINTAEKYGIIGPVVLTASYANPEQSGRADRLGREERTKYIAACCQILLEAGYTPMLHTDEAFLAEKLNAEKLSCCQLWLTGYDPELTYTGSCAIRQYTDRGTVDGISGYAGLNISYGK